MHIPHAIRTSPGSLTSLMRPYKGALRPATAGFRVQRCREMARTPYYLRPPERAVHIGSSTNTWGPLKPSQMWNFDVVQARLKLNRFCPQLPGKHCSLGQRVPDLSSLQYITIADYSHPRRTHTSGYYPLPSQRAPQAGAFWVTSRRGCKSASGAGRENPPGSTEACEEAPCPPLLEHLGHGK